MTCTICAGVGQFGLNLAEIADRVLNTLLLGNPTETVSRRTARARRAGERWAKVACKCLSALFWFMHRDHCTWALEAGSDAKEIWHWV